ATCRGKLSQADRVLSARKMAEDFGSDLDCFDSSTVFGSHEVLTMWNAGASDNCKILGGNRSNVPQGGTGIPKFAGGLIWLVLTAQRNAAIKGEANVSYLHIPRDLGRSCFAHHGLICSAKSVRLSR